MKLWRVPRSKRSASADHATPIILLYHSVQRVRTDPFGVRVSPRNFAEHMAVLRANANLLSLAQLHECLEGGRVPPRAVAVTFDDGYADNLHHALPVLQRLSIPATVFIATGYIGGTVEFWWDELDRLLLQPGTLPREVRFKLKGESLAWPLHDDFKYSRVSAWRNRRWHAWDEPPPTARHKAYREMWRLMQRSDPIDREAALEQLRACLGATARSRPTHRALTCAELVTLAKSPLIEIGAHTVMHPALAAIPHEMQRHEIVQSKQWLENTLDRPVTSFSYPFGTRTDYTDQTVVIVKEAGFQRACSNFAARLDSNADRFQFPRHVAADWDGCEFSQKYMKWFGE